MSIMWIVAGIAAAVAAVVILALKFRRPRPDSMGVMNDQWLAEQRLTHGPDPNR